MTKTMGSRRRLASFIMSVAVLSASTVAHGEDDVAAQKKQCLLQHEQSQVLKQSTKLKEARDALLACSREACPSFVRGDCVEWLTQLDKVMPSVVIAAKVNRKDEFAVKVAIDGQLAAATLDGRPIELNPGVHSFKFETAGWPANEQQILIVEGEKNHIVSVQFGTAVDDKGVEVVVPTQRPVPALVYVLGATTLAGAGVFAAFGEMGQSKKNDLAHSCEPFCAKSDVDKVKSKFLVADVGLGVAVASVIVGGLVFLTRPEIPIEPEGKKTPGKFADTIRLGIEPRSSGAFMSVQGAL